MVYIIVHHGNNIEQLVADSGFGGAGFPAGRLDGRDAVLCDPLPQVLRPHRGGQAIRTQIGG
jgi:hypothetical protein